MKTSKPAMAAVVAAALMSLGNTAKGDVPTNITLLENLTPEQRSSIEDQIRVIETQVVIDWNNFTVGANEKGEIIFISRKQIENRVVAGPSCWYE